MAIWSFLFSITWQLKRFQYTVSTLHLKWSLILRFSSIHALIPYLPNPTHLIFSIQYPLHSFIHLFIHSSITIYSISFPREIYL